MNFSACSSRLAAAGLFAFACGLSLFGRGLAFADAYPADPRGLPTDGFYYSTGIFQYPGGERVDGFMLSGFQNIVEEVTVDEITLTFDAVLESNLVDSSGGRTPRLDFGQAKIRRPRDVSTARITFTSPGAQTSPSPESVGIFSVAPWAGGGYRTESTFDMYFNMSFGGSPLVGALDGPVHMELMALPEPSTLSGAALFGAVLLGCVRRRRALEGPAVVF